MTTHVCRQCGAPLTEATSAAATCPGCGASVSPPKSATVDLIPGAQTIDFGPGDAAAPDAPPLRSPTVPDVAAGGRTLDFATSTQSEAAFSVEAGPEKTYAPLPHNATVDLGPGGASPHDDDSFAVGSDSAATIDPPSVDDAPAGDDSKPGTVYPLPHNATVDFGPNAPAGGGAAPIDASFDLPQKPGTVHPLPHLATVEPHGGAIGSGSGDSATYDSAAGSFDLGQQLSQVWGDDVDEQAPARFTIKGKQRDSRRNDQTLVVNTRAVRDGSRVATVAGSIDYELLNMLGQGGMGVVYAARQASIDRTVAVKMLKPKLGGSRDSQQKFLSEAVVTGDLDHPNIVPIYDLGKNENGDLFYAMKKVEGTPWSKAIFTRTRSENIEILLKCADAVAFAHARGIVHRDLKPENVMLGDFGEVLVMDWGLAYSTPQFRKSASITHTHSMGGSPAYMAPEMATGPIERISASSDVYLLGAILYEIVTGKPPHTGSNVSKCLMAAARNEIVPTEITGELIDIALQAMATDQKDRFASVRDFQAAIRGYLAHSESIALTAQANEALADARVNNDYQTFARAVFGFEQALGLWDGNAEAVSGLVVAKTAYAECAFARGDYDLAAGLLDRSRPVQAALLDKIDAARKERDARQARLRSAKQFAAALVVGLFVVGTVAIVAIRMQRDRAFVAEAAARDAERKAELERDNAEQAEAQAELDRDLARKAEIQATHDRDLARQAKDKEEYSAYAARIGLAAARIDENAFEGAIQLLDGCPPKLRNWEWGRLRFLCERSRLTIAAAAPITAVALDPTGTHCAAGGWNGTLRIWNIVDGAPLVDLPYQGSFVHAVAFSPDGRYVAAGGSDKQNYVRLYEAAHGKPVRSFVGHSDAVLSVAFDNRGERLLTASYDGTVRLWKTATGEELDMWHPHTSGVTSARFAPDEQSIVSTGLDGNAIVISLATDKRPAPAAQREATAAVETPAVEVRAYLGHEGRPVHAAAYSPDGRTVATAGDDGQVLIWNPAEVRPYRLTEVVVDGRPVDSAIHKLADHRAAAKCVAFSPDGRRLVSGGLDNALIVWNTATGRAEKTLRGHGKEVRACAVSPDGKLVVSGALDGTIRVWDIDAYSETQTVQPIALAAHADAVLAADFAPDGESIVTASRDRTAKLWNLQTLAATATLAEGHDYLASSAAVTADAKHLVTAAVDGTARVWNLADGVETVAVKDTGRSAVLAVSPDGKLVLTGNEDNGAKLWESATGRVVRVLPKHKTELTVAGISPDGSLIVTGESSGRANVWRTADASPVWSELHHSRKLTAVAFVAAGKQLLTASLDNTVGRWDVETGRELTSLVWKHPEGVVGLTLVGAEHAATACEDGIVRLWRLTDEASTADLPQAVELPLPPGAYAAVASSGDGRILAAVDREAGRVRLWDVAAKREVSAPQSKSKDAAWLDLSANAALWTAAFTPDGESLVTVGGNEAQLWSVKNTSSRVDFRPHGAVAGVAYAPDGQFVATAGWDGAVKIWSVAEGRAVRKLAGGHKGIVNSVAYDRAGRRLLTSGDDATARLWDVESGKEVAVFAGHADRVLHAAFAPDGDRIVTASADKTARIWNAADGRLLQELTGGHAWAVLDVEFDAAGKRVVSAGADDVAVLWDAATGDSLGVLTGHTAPVTSAAFAPDGLRVVTASRDGNVKIWDAAENKELLTLRSHKDEVTVAKFSPNGRSILSASRDGGVILWPTAPW